MKNLLILTVLMLFVSITIYSQNDPKELLESVRSKFNSFEDMGADFKQSSNNKVNLKGRVNYAKGNKFRVDLQNSIIISDGKTVWNYNKAKNQVIINNSDSGASFLSINNFLYYYPSKCSLSISREEGKNVLLLTPVKESGLDFSKASIFVNKDNLISKVIIETVSGKPTIFELSEYSINKNIPDSKFTFTPKEGTKVIDFRK